MAAQSEIQTLRRLIAEDENKPPYTDASLSERIDAASGDLNAVASAVWREKAARYADLVDVSEGGSSRKMGDLHEQALNMAEYFAELVPDGVRPRRTRVHKLAR